MELPPYSTDDAFNPQAPWRDMAQIVVGEGLTSVPESVTRMLLNDEWGIPTDSYLADVIQFGESRTEGNILFHLMSGLATLAVVAERGLDSTIFPGTSTLSNLWVLLVGPSATSKKTTCMTLQTKPLSAIAPTLVLSKPGSAQGLTKHLAAKPVCLMVLPEFGDFLAATSKDAGSSFYGQVKESLVKWFDGESESIPYSQETITVVDPRLSLLAATAPAFLSDHTSPRDWEGGLYSRFVVVYTNAERVVDIPDGSDEALAVSNRARRRVERWLRTGPEGGREFPMHPAVTMDPEAQEVWRAWVRILKHRQEMFSEYPAINSAMGRVTLHTAKMSLLLSMNAGLCEGGPWSLRARELALAIRITDRCHLASVVPVIESAQDSIVKRMKAQIIQMLQRKETRSLGEFTEVMGQLKGTLTPVLDTLVGEGKILCRTRDGELLYSLRKKTLDPAEGLPEAAVALARLMREGTP